MSRWLKLSALLGAGGLFVAACGASRPLPEDVFHDPALRRSSVDASSEAEEALLARLPGASPGESVAIAGVVFVPGPTYEAASGRHCLRIDVQGAGAGAPARLACESEGGPWVFVPDVFGGDDPFSREDRVASEVER